jgi:peptide/nickel transport system permease protein
VPSARSDAGPARDARLASGTRRSFGLCVVVSFVAIAIFAPGSRPYDPLATSMVGDPQGASAAHGSDGRARSATFFPRDLRRARVVLAGVVSVSIALSFGIPIGLLAGYSGSPDAIISRMTDAMLATLSCSRDRTRRVFGPSLTNAYDRHRHLGDADLHRLTRASALVKVEDYVEAARASAIRKRAWRCRPSAQRRAALIVQATLAIAAAVIAEASLSFLGLGQTSRRPSWGKMLNTAKNYVEHARGWRLWPGASIFLLVLSFNLLGDGLRDALDPRHA